MSPGERQPQAALERRLKDLEPRGVLWHHCPDSRRCHGPLGFPDVLAIGPGGLLVYEMKMPYNDTTAEQDAWLWAFDKRMGGVPHIMGARSPVDLASGLIDVELGWLAGIGG